MGKVDKPISYYAKYLGGHPRYPGDEDIGVYIHPTLLELAFKGHNIIIPYSDIKNITNIDKGKVVDGGNTAVGLMVLGPFGLLMMRRKVNAMLIEYDNDKETSEAQTVALDFWGNTKYAQPIIYDRTMKARNNQSKYQIIGSNKNNDSISKSKMPISIPTYSIHETTKSANDKDNISKSKMPISIPSHPVNKTKSIQVFQFLYLCLYVCTCLST